MEKIGPPRYELPNPEWWRRDGEIWVYANMLSDMENHFISFVRNIEIDPSGKVYRTESWINID
ncbi:MAG: hypothetical protein SGI88_04350 [Candidatus Hydrogenedentes bacterium]|nr:hypothetical protein [Candidatus Hydrogenedentota bacterium]